MALCLTCSKQNTLHSVSNKKAAWLQNNNRRSAIPPNAPLPDTRPFHPSNSSVHIDVTIGGKDRNVLFWGAQSRVISSVIPSAPQAYGKYPNMGIAKVRKGVLTLSCQSPRPYHEDGKTWPCHIHYANPSATESNTWDTTVHAVAAYPGHHEDGQTKYLMHCIDDQNPKCSILTPDHVWKHWNKLIVVNALPEKYPSIAKSNAKHAKHALHIPYDAPNSAINKASKLIGEHAYVVYCMHSKCHAASTLIQRLMATKYAKNVYYMPSGQMGWSRMVNQRTNL